MNYVTEDWAGPGLLIIILSCDSPRIQASLRTKSEPSWQPGGSSHKKSSLMAQCPRGICRDSHRHLQTCGNVNRSGGLWPPQSCFCCQMCLLERLLGTSEETLHVGQEGVYRGLQCPPPNAHFMEKNQMSRSEISLWL